jgi:hypothetical protein
MSQLTGVHQDHPHKSLGWPLAFYLTAENYRRCGTMAAIELSEETVRRLRASDKIIKVILGSRKVPKTKSEAVKPGD